jgi:hypothetical protein
VTARRAAAITLAMLAGGSGCTHGTSTPSGSGTSTTTSSSTSQEPSVNDSQLGEAALRQQRERVRVLVDGVMPLAPGARWVPTSDGEAPCGTPSDGGWPKIWDYSIRAVSGGPAGLGPRIVQRFEAAGWSFTAVAAAPGVTRLKARRDGILLVVASGKDGATVDVSADSPCVEQDGTVRA